MIARRYSDRNASVTSTRAAHSDGKTHAITAAASSSTTTEATSGNVVGICSDGNNESPGVSIRSQSPHPQVDL
jgi:hypothetical protein